MKNKYFRSAAAFALAMIVACGALTGCTGTKTPTGSQKPPTSQSQQQKPDQQKPDKGQKPGQNKPGQQKPQDSKALTIITVKDLSFCPEHRSVEIAGKRIDLTEKEFDILALLIMNQRQVFTHEMMMDIIWNKDFSFYSRNALSSHISNLRKKLKLSGSVADHIKSIRGIGYKFEA